MMSYQRVALFILFDSIERDLINHIRLYSSGEPQLTSEERDKASRCLASKADVVYNISSNNDLLYGLDLAEKFQVLMRSKGDMPSSERSYFQLVSSQMMRSVSVRNAIMHGRPLTLDEHVFALAFAQSLLNKPVLWPTLSAAYSEYANNPAAFLQRTVEFLDDSTNPEVLNNLPVPDFDDTGFLPRPDLERDLKRKILGRHPVITVLGEGGNGKTALALRVLYGLVASSDHEFDAIIWVSAKTSELQISGIAEIRNAATKALDVIELACALEASEGTPKERLNRFLLENKVLLVVDNYETVIGTEISEFAEEVPGESKLLFTSRKPVGSDLTVQVGEFTPQEAEVFFRRLVDAYSVRSLWGLKGDAIDSYNKRLSYKPLLIKWFVLGVKSGLQPDRILANPEIALRFCLDNVILNLGEEAQAVLVVLATLPSRVSSGVIGHVARLSPTNVGDGLAELSRVGLVDAASSPEGRQVFGIRSFARTYIHRLIIPSPEITDQILANYRLLEADFQEQRRLNSPILFKIGTYKVESRSQMLAVRKLREAIRYANESEFQASEESLRDAKSIDPTYFECHKVEALVALQQNDWSRAISAYETAIELSPIEPQLHFFFAGLLMRLNENDRAAEEFADAIRLCPSDGILHREAARNEMIRCNFAEARVLLEKAYAFGIEMDRERIKLFDLKIQLHGRTLEFEIRHDRLAQAESAANELLEFLAHLDVCYVDQRMKEHIGKYVNCLRFLNENVPGSCAEDVLEIIKSRLQADPSPTYAEGDEGEVHVGYMREQGRKPQYGFLRSETCQDTFVHISEVSSDLWEWMLGGGRIRFEREPSERGRAIHIKKDQ